MLSQIITTNCVLLIFIIIVLNFLFKIKVLDKKVLDSDSLWIVGFGLYIVLTFLSIFLHIIINIW